MMRLALLALLLLQVQSNNAELGYQLTVPEGFTAFPEAKAQSADLLDCWAETTPASSAGTMVICVQRLHGVLPHEAMKASEVPAGSQLLPFKWKTFDVQGISTT